MKHTTNDELLLLLLLLLSHFSCVQLCATPQMTTHQAPLSLGFSRQEYWSGLPFPSPMHTCMLSRFSCVWLCATLWTAAHQAPLSTGFSRQEYWSGLPFPSPNNELGVWKSGVKGVPALPTTDLQFFIWWSTHHNEAVIQLSVSRFYILDQRAC